MRVAVFSGPKYCESETTIINCILDGFINQDNYIVEKIVDEKKYHNSLLNKNNILFIPTLKQESYLSNIEYKIIGNYYRNGIIFLSNDNKNKFNKITCEIKEKLKEINFFCITDELTNFPNKIVTYNGGISTLSLMNFFILQVLGFNKKEYANSREVFSNEKFRIHSVLKWADENISKIKSVEQLVKMSCTCRRNFDRRFREITGESPKNWLINRKIIIAKQMISNSYLSYEEISDRCGFNSVTTLRYHFKKREGNSLSKYRKIHTYMNT